MYTKCPKCAGTGKETKRPLIKGSRKPLFEKAVIAPCSLCNGALTVTEAVGEQYQREREARMP
jgi:hypothetical protein